MYEICMKNRRSRNRESIDGYRANDFAHGAAESEMLSFRSVAKWVTSPTRLLELATRFPQGHRVGDTALETDVCAVTFDAACPQDQPLFLFTNFVQDVRETLVRS
ncbi:hypothetical protein K0M31_007643 [Melipona bicolor]|uniref:Uncharacterized protein n=1 Tax=Melipona bicolor TaxID=60889 RepID=A0AA40GC39_9HYME|nr:hypothetical protein K0M31_007643 [Melipona bicolor]